MLIIPDLPKSIYVDDKRFVKHKPPRFVFGNNFLMVHGSSEGKLTIPDEDLGIMLPFLQGIICCYPRRVCEVYHKLFPGIEKLIIHKWADIPTCYGLFDQPNGLVSMAVFDYNPSNKEWKTIASEVSRKVQASR